MNGPAALLPRVLCARALIGYAVLCLAGAMGGCTEERTARPDRQHPTLVSLNPCTDAILAEVANPGQIRAISHFSHDPRAASMPEKQARRFRATGGTAEEVLALNPDIVVASSFLPPSSVEAFRRLGIRVETFGVASTVEDSEAQVRRLAALAGHPDRGKALVARIEQALAQTRTSGPPVSALIWQEGGLVPGEEALIARLLAHTGFSSLSAARGLGQGAYLPLERVLADPPRVILAAGGERMLSHPALRQLGSVHYERLNPSLLYCGGPTIIRALERLQSIRERLP